MLADSGHLQEEEAHYLGRHKLSRHETPEPLYDQDDAEACRELFQSVDFHQVVQLGDIRFHLRPVGHILGAAWVIIEAEGKHLGFPATTVYPAGDHPGHLARGFADKNDVDQPNCCGSCVRYSLRCGSTKIALSLNSMVKNE